MEAPPVEEIEGVLLPEGWCSVISPPKSHLLSPAGIDDKGKPYGRVKVVKGNHYELFNENL